MLKHSDFDQTDTAVRAKILSEALPYIQKFSNRTIVVKYGGAAMKDSSLKDKVMQDIVLLNQLIKKTIGLQKAMLSLIVNYQIFNCGQ